MLRASHICPPAEKWGLLYFVDPQLSAFEANIFWRPDMLAGALRVRLFPLQADGKIDGEDQDIIVLSAIKTGRILFDTVDGMRHILLNGQRFWIQLYCDNPGLSCDHASIGIRMDQALHMGRRLDTATQLLSLHRSAGGKLSLIGRHKDSTSLANALNAFDVWHGFERPKGGLKEIAEAIVGKDRVANEWRQNRSLKDMARRARDKGVSFVEGDYRVLLTKKVL